MQQVLKGTHTRYSFITRSGAIPFKALFVTIFVYALWCCYFEFLNLFVICAVSRDESKMLSSSFSIIIIRSCIQI